MRRRPWPEHPPSLSDERRLGGIDDRTRSGGAFRAPVLLMIRLLLVRLFDGDTNGQYGSNHQRNGSQENRETVKASAYPR